MGNGSAKLDIEVVMGHAQVRVGSDRVEPREAGADVTERRAGAGRPAERARAPGPERLPGVR